MIRYLGYKVSRRDDNEKELMMSERGFERKAEKEEEINVKVSSVNEHCYH